MMQMSMNHFSYEKLVIFPFLMRYLCRRLLNLLLSI